jgi:hypothetical protein
LFIGNCELNQDESIVESGFPPVVEGLDWSDQQLAYNPFDPTDQQGQIPTGQDSSELGFENQRNLDEFLNQGF